jgi:hypothetical protein
VCIFVFLISLYARLGPLEAAYFAGVRYLFCTEVVADVVGLELASCGGWGGLSCNVEPRVCIACEVHFQTLLGRKLLQLFLSWCVCVCVFFFGVANYFETDPTAGLQLWVSVTLS